MHVALIDLQTVKAAMIRVGRGSDVDVLLLAERRVKRYLEEDYVLIVRWGYSGNAGRPTHREAFVILVTRVTRWLFGAWHVGNLNVNEGTR